MKTTIALGLGLIAGAAQAQNGPADPAVNETFKFAKPAQSLVPWKTLCHFFKFI